MLDEESEIMELWQSCMYGGSVWFEWVDCEKSLWVVIEWTKITRGGLMYSLKVHQSNMARISSCVIDDKMLDEIDFIFE